MTKQGMLVSDVKGVMNTNEGKSAVTARLTCNGRCKTAAAVPHWQSIVIWTWRTSTSPMEPCMRRVRCSAMGRPKFEPCLAKLVSRAVSRPTLPARYGDGDRPARPSNGSQQRNKLMGA